jgi:hypothetical protein
MFWVLDVQNSLCYLKTGTAIENRQSKQNVVSGSKHCPGMQQDKFKTSIQWYKMTQFTLKP